MEVDSEGSVESDIPEEHENGYGFNEYTRRYDLNIRTFTWDRDSQGLFDFETRHFSKEQILTAGPGSLVRHERDIKLHAPGFDLKAAYEQEAQKLAVIKKVRNHYVVESPDVQRLAEAQDAEQRKEIMTRDIDFFYRTESGRPKLPPSEMNEKIYRVVRNSTNRNVKQECVLKKFDVIKLGRVKFKVKEIQIKSVNDAKRAKQELMKRREEKWKKKELSRIGEQMLLLQERPHNSARVQVEEARFQN